MSFSQQDYESKDGMLTTVWGPMIWNTLHLISFNYPVHPTEEDKKHYHDYLVSLGNVLPCKYCRDNYRANLTRTGFAPTVFNNRETFSRFIYDLHNEVNKMLKKPIELSYEDVRDRYENFRARCVKDTLPKSTELVRQSTEEGCTVPFYGQKSKCVIHIVPQTAPASGFVMDPSCAVRKTISVRGRGRGRGGSQSGSRGRGRGGQTLVNLI